MTIIKSSSSIYSSSSSSSIKMVPTRKTALSFDIATWKLPVSSMKRPLPTTSCCSAASLGYETHSPTTKTVTISAPSNNTMSPRDGGGSSLQSTNKRRKYMRRGSKCPSMLTLSALPLSTFFENEDVPPQKNENNKSSKCGYDEKNAIAVLTEALNLSSSSFETPMVTTNC